MDDEDLCIGFVFEKWLDAQMFTDHSKEMFEWEDVKVLQGKFLHTKETDLTGAVVWDDAVVLSKFLRRNIDLKMKRVVELGAGTGFLGVALGKLGTADKVVISDRSVMKDLIVHNIEANHVINQCEFWDHSWGSSIDESMLGSFDIVVASGCVYHDEANASLIDSIAKLGKVNAEIYFAIDFRFDVSNRDIDEYVSPTLYHFFTLAERKGLVMETIELNQLLTSEDIKLSVRIYKCHVRA